MHWVQRALFWIAAVGSCTSAIYCVMVLVAAAGFYRRRRREERELPTYLPAVSVLKPLHGTEPGMERNFETFFEQDYPDFELLFCARHENDAGLQLAAKVAARYPGVRAKFITCGEPRPQFHNAKVYSLAKLSSVAASPLFITSDADVRVRPGYLRAMVQPLRDPQLALAWSVYIGTTTGGFSSQLDAVGKSVEMTGGVLVAAMLEGVKFALGATMATRRESFEAVGGFDDLGQFYADDFVLGNRLATQGRGVKLSTHVIRLMVQDSPFALSFRNQLRWMQSTRRSRPWGHLGTGLTFAIPFGLLGLLWGFASGHAGIGLLWLFAAVFNRWALAAGILLALGDPEWLWHTGIYPVRDALGSALWLASYGGDNFYYRGTVYKLQPGGRVQAPD